MAWWSSGPADLELFQGEGLHGGFQGVHFPVLGDGFEVNEDDLGKLGNEDLHDLSFGHDHNLDAEVDVLLAVDAAGAGGPPGGEAGFPDFQGEAEDLLSLGLGHVGGDDDVLALEGGVEGAGKGADVLDAVVHEVFDEGGGDNVAGGVEIHEGDDDEFPGKIDAMSPEFVDEVFRAQVGGLAPGRQGGDIEVPGHFLKQVAVGGLFGEEDDVRVFPGVPAVALVVIVEAEIPVFEKAGLDHHHEHVRNDEVGVAFVGADAVEGVFDVIPEGPKIADVERGLASLQLLEGLPDYILDEQGLVQALGTVAELLQQFGL